MNKMLNVLIPVLFLTSCSFADDLSRTPIPLSSNDISTGESISLDSTYESVEYSSTDTTIGTDSTNYTSVSVGDDERDYNDYKVINKGEMFTQSETMYLVYVYQNDDTRCETIKNEVFDFIESREEKNAKYGVYLLNDVSDFIKVESHEEAKARSLTQNETNKICFYEVPTMYAICDKKIMSVYAGINEIRHAIEINK